MPRRARRIFQLSLPLGTNNGPCQQIGGGFFLQILGGSRLARATTGIVAASPVTADKIE